MQNISPDAIPQLRGAIPDLVSLRGVKSRVPRESNLSVGHAGDYLAALARTVFTHWKLKAYCQIAAGRAPSPIQSLPKIM